MSPPVPDHERLTRLFSTARRLPPAERVAFVDAECAGDRELRAELQALLDQLERTPDFLDESSRERDLSALAADALAAEGAPLPESIGPYRVLRRLGAGGMGVVYEAEQPELRRRVALKVVHPGALTGRALRRFRVEVEILGQLHHPGIAQVHDAALEGAVPYFAMELVEGLPLVEHARRLGLDLRARAALLADVCDAVHHAHQKGVLHRDLKPSNILVEPGGQPKVLDFGVARTLGAEGVTTLVTDARQLVGTLPYMSPEQAAGDPRAVDARSDVYALGVLLYELASGRLPLQLDDLPLPEAARRVCEQEPPPLGRLVPALRGELETIAAKALDKDPARRYASAAELAADLRRWLAGEPVLAVPASRVYLLRKFARRNRVLVGAGALLLTTLAVATAVTTALWLDVRAEERAAAAARDLAREEADRARREARTSARVTGFLTELFRKASPDAVGAERFSARDLLDAGAEQIAGDLEEEPAVRAELLSVLGGVYLYFGLYDTARPLLEESLELWRGLDGADALAEADALERAALLVRLDGRFVDELALRRRVLAAREAELEPPHRLLLDARANLAFALVLAGRREEADALLPRIESEAIALGEPGRAARLLVPVVESHLAREDGRLGDGLAHIERGVDLALEGFGPDHPRTLELRRLQGIALLDLADAARAAEVLGDVAARSRQLYGEASQMTLSTILDHAIALQQAGELRAAEQRYEEARALPAWERAEAASLRVQAMENHAGLLDDLGRREEAVARYREAAAAWRALDREADVARAEHNLSVSLDGLGRHAEALALAEEVVAIRERLLGPTHPETLISRSNRALIRLDLGRVDEAEAELSALLDATDERSDWLRLQARMDWARFLAETGRADERRAWLEATRPLLTPQNDPNDYYASRLARELGP